jgi:hypothetical protein
MTNGETFVYQKGLGEDAYYCQLARRIGHKIVVDTGLVCGHIGNINYDGAMHEDLLRRGVASSDLMEPIMESQK